MKYTYIVSSTDADGWRCNHYSGRLYIFAWGCALALRLLGYTGVEITKEVED